MLGLELIPHSLLFLREGKKNTFLKVPLFLREGFRVSCKFSSSVYSLSSLNTL
jgi:hypothetical protein